MSLSQSTAAIPALPGIDTADGLRRMMNKPALYERVLRDFYLRFQGETERIQAALAAGDQETAQRRAHSAKGLAGSIGARDLQTASQQLEVGIRDNCADLPARLQAFAGSLQVVIAGIGANYPDCRTG